MKRYTQLPQLVLGIAFSWPIPMAFAAVLGYIPGTAWFLFLATILWVVTYDTFYAMVDRDDDLVAGIKSTAILFGENDRLITGILQAAFSALLLLIGQLFQLGTLFYVSVLIVIGLQIYQQILIANREKERCFKAFLNNHYVGMAIFVGIASDYLIS
jgi:4-hydroxybenzoate polyprenyltransferase